MMSDSEKLVGQAMENLDVEMWAWVKASIGLIVASMSGAVVFLFRYIMTTHAKQIEETQQAHTTQLTELRKESDECREDRKMLRIENVEIRIRLATLETKISNGNDHASG